MDERVVNAWRNFKKGIRKITNISGQIDTDDAAERIKNGVWFRGPNVYILAFSIVIASVGLNVNSTAVVIGAMLISPLMGPIIGMGLAMGTNDAPLLRVALHNLLVMMAISLLASTLYFLLSPLNLTNPTELLARTSPTIYDVLIALFGGLAGILENSRKERGTVLSGVAIATALMPPLCTAGYGLAHLNMRYFFGALYLFVINGIFITLATFVMVKYLRFKTVETDRRISARNRRLMTALLVAFLVPSVWNVVILIKDNNFERRATAFVQENRLVGRTYVYDYEVTKGRDRHLELALAGERLSSDSRTTLLENAKAAGIKENQLIINEHTVGMTYEDMQELVREIYDRTDAELEVKEAELVHLRQVLDSLSGTVGTLTSTLDSLSNLVDALVVLPVDELPE